MNQLRLRLLATMAAMVSLLALAIVGGLEMNLRAETRAGLRADLDRTADALVDHLADLTDRLELEARVIADQPRLKAVVTTPGVDQATVEDVSHELRDLVGWDLILVTDTSGTVIGALDGAAPPALLAAASGRPASGVWTDGDGVWLVAASPIAFDTHVVGAVAAGDALSRERLAALSQATQAEIVLFAGETPIGSSLPEGAPIPDPSAEQVELDGEIFLARRVPLGTDGVSAVALRSQDEAFAPYRRRRASMLAVVAVALVIGMAATWQVAARLSRPVAELADRLRRLVEGMPDAIAVSRDGRLFYTNPAFQRRFGSPGSLEESVVPRDRERLARAIGRTSREEVPDHLELRFVGQDDRVVDVELDLEPLRLDGSPVLLAICRDVTDRRRMQAQLLQSERLASLGTVAAGVAHEINNPLAYVMTNVGFAVEQLGDLRGGHQVEEVREALLDAREGADRVRIIVRDLQTFSRMDGDALEDVDLRQVAVKAIKMARVQILDRARLEERLDEVPPVRGNEGRLTQVILNLLVNAAQAIPRGASRENRVRVTTRTDDAGRAVVEVADTGEGIPDDVRDRIFEPFFTTKAPSEGTGLGLSICHDIVAKLGGSVEVESAPGRGTCFRVVLPAGG